MTQHDQEGLERAGHERLDRVRRAGKLEEERAETEELRARLGLALPPERRGFDPQGDERIAAREHAVLTADVVELHRESVARPVEILPVQENGQGEAPLPTARDDRREALEDVERDARDDDRR